MFERFTKDARAIVERARAEAQALGHDRIGTEHLVLGGASAAGLDPEVLRAETPATTSTVMRSPRSGSTSRPSAAASSPPSGWAH